jgi:hypothetical protein
MDFTSWTLKELEINGEKVETRDALGVLGYWLNLISEKRMQF